MPQKGEKPMKRLISIWFKCYFVDYTAIRALWKAVDLITEDYKKLLILSTIYDEDTKRIRTNNCNETLGLIETIMGVK